MSQVTVRKAGIKDAQFICTLINAYAEKGVMMPRALGEYYDNMRDFFVAESNGQLVGCAALHIVWDNLAEIKSLAVDRELPNMGAGRMLVERCLAESRELEIEKVFCLTFITEFFRKLGFKDISKGELPHKVWAECIKCPKFPDCDEQAMVYAPD